MKTIIFFLALFMSFFTIMNTIACVLNNIAKALYKKEVDTSLIPELIQGFIAIALWTYFYYLN